MADQSFDWEKCLEYAALSDVGMRRANNQDAMAVAMAGSVQDWYDRGHVFVVADGMGAHAAGELASKLAVDNVPHLYHKHRDVSPPEALQKAIFETNQEIHRRGEANTDFHKMGTTCEALVLLPQGALVAHVGDSRVYLQRGDKLQQLTFDHSLVWEMRASGQLPGNGDFTATIPKNVITRSLGPNPRVKVDVEGPFPVAVGDRFLLCSDGLTGKVKDEELGPILASLGPDEAARVLVDLANLRGGPDNITVIIVNVTGPEITTRVAGAEPLTVGGDEDRDAAVHPALWIVMGVCFLAAIGMAAVGQAIPALLAALGGLVAAAVGILQKFGGFGSAGVVLGAGRRLGRGPYTQTSCWEDATVLADMARLTQELREAADEGEGTADFTTFDDHCQKAILAADAGDQPQAVRAYAHAISLMMQQLREQEKKEQE